MLMEDTSIEWEAPGFNAGLFSLRPAEWRDLSEKARDLIERFGADTFSKSKDQQLLNIIFSGRQYPFSKRYNFSPLYDEGFCDPAIIHYLAKEKPWHAGYPAGHRYDEFRTSMAVIDYPEIMLTDMYRWIRSIRERIGAE